MFVDVQFDVTLGPGIILPADAILDTGLRKSVFVDRGSGFFEPCEVETGARMGDRGVVTGGLAPGERVVVSGNFLLDSETRLKLAAAGVTADDEKDPVFGMRVKASAAGQKTSPYEGKTYHFCSDACKRQFDENPRKYLVGLPSRRMLIS